MKQSLERIVAGMSVVTFFTGANLAYANKYESGSEGMYALGMGLFTTGVAGLCRRYITKNGD